MVQLARSRPARAAWVAIAAGALALAYVFYTSYGMRLLDTKYTADISRVRGAGSGRAAHPSQAANPAPPAACRWRAAVLAHRRRRRSSSECQLPRGGGARCVRGPRRRRGGGRRRRRPPDQQRRRAHVEAAVPRGGGAVRGHQGRVVRELLDAGGAATQAAAQGQPRVPVGARRQRLQLCWCDGDGGSAHPAPPPPPLLLLLLHAP